MTHTKAIPIVLFSLSIANLERNSMFKKHLIVLSVILSSVLLPGLSNAACNLNGVVVRVTANDDAFSATAGFIYFRSSSLAPYYYFTSTTDDDMISNAIAYMNSGRTATFSGNAAACPPVPVAGGAVGIGALNFMYNP